MIIPQQTGFCSWWINIIIMICNKLYSSGYKSYAECPVYFLYKLCPQPHSWTMPMKFKFQFYCQLMSLRAWFRIAVQKKNQGLLMRSCITIALSTAKRPFPGDPLPPSPPVSSPPFLTLMALICLPCVKLSPIPVVFFFFFFKSA